MNKTLSPEQFAIEVKAIVDQKKTDNDPEMFHSRYDALLEETLRALGYGKGLDLIKGMKMWFA